MMIMPERATLQFQNNLLDQANNIWMRKFCTIFRSVVDVVVVVGVVAVGIAVAQARARPDQGSWFIDAVILAVDLRLRPRRRR